MEKIRLDEIQIGDRVVLRDTAKNFIEGEVLHEGDDWFICAFNTKIKFAQDRRNGLGLRAIPRIHVAGHIAQLVNG